MVLKSLQDFAAPKRAFAELTAKTYGELVSDALLEVEADPGSFVVGDAEYSALVAAAVLRRLQAFAAPVAPAWQPIEPPKRRSPTIMTPEKSRMEEALIEYAEGRG